MSRKISKKDNRYLARLVTGERAPCAFCLREVDDEITYGKLYAIGDIQCHYFCCLLSCCLIQKGQDEEGLFGFMYSDILAEVERCKKHKCSYCGRSGANLGCSVGACRKQFHVPCGRDKNAVSLYYGSYKSFCQQHAPRQKIPDHIMENARQRMRRHRSKGTLTAALAVKDCEAESSEEMVCVICYEAVDGFPTVNTFWPPCCGKDAWFHRTCLQRMALSAGMHYLKCPLCNDKESFYDAVVGQGYYVPDRDAAWELEQNAFAEIYERAASCGAPRCLCPLGRGHDADSGEWDIKLCLLCGSAGAHAQCIDQSQPSEQISDQSENISTTINQSELTYKDLKSLSLEENFSRNGDVLSEELNKSDQLNTSPNQLNILPNQMNTSLNQLNTLPNQLNTLPSQLNTLPNQLDTSPNQLNTLPNQLITSPNQLNTSVKSHSGRFVCKSCLPAAPQDLNALAASIEAIIQQEQSETASEARRPLMPSRMSIRRTKGRADVHRPSTSRSYNRAEIENKCSESPNVVSSRLDLNLKTPRRVSEPARATCLDNKMSSPVKLLEQSFREKMVCAGVRDAVLDEAVVEALRRRFRKPRPMCERRRIVNDILDGIFDGLVKESKRKELLKEWRSPKKCNSLDYEEVDESSKELENCQNKENDSNMSNTSTNDATNVNLEEGILNLVNKDENTNNNVIKFENSNMDSNATVNMNIEEVFNSNDPKVDNIDKLKGDVIQNEADNDFKCTIVENLSKNDTNSHCDADIEESSKNISVGSCEIINDSSYTNSRHLSEICEENDFETVDKPTKSEENRVTKNSIGNIDERKCNSNKNKIPLKIKFAKNKRKSRGVEKSKHCSNDNRSKDRKIRSKSESSSDINILKGLLSEQELCSQLLLELTTGKVSENSTGSNLFESQKDINNSDEETKSIKETSKHSDVKDRTEISETTKRNENTSESKKTKSHKTRKRSSNKHSKRRSISVESRKSRTQNDQSRHSKDGREELNKTTKELITNESAESPKSQESITEVQTLTNADIFDDTLSPIEKKHKTIEIQQDSSLEISENDQHIKIDVIKIEDSPTTDDSYKKLKINLPDQLKTCFKFNPIGEVLDKTDVGMDLESFKKEYLNEVDREFKCSFEHKHEDKKLERKFISPIDFAMDAAIEKESATRSNKRKLTETGVKLIFDNMPAKRRKMSEGDLKLTYAYDKKIPEDSNDAIEEKVENDEGKKKTEKGDKRRRKKETKEKRKKKRNRNKSPDDKNIKVTIDSSEKRSAKNKKIKKKIKTKFAIENENIQVKIKWKKKQFSLNIESKDQRKEKKNKDDRSKFKQYVLQFPEGSTKEVLVKPEKEVCPLKRKYVKNEKSPDKLKQMSIQSFFKLKLEK